MSKPEKLRVLVTAGGTGGHIQPTIAVVAELQQLAANMGVDLEVRYMGAPGQFVGLLEGNEIRVQKVAGSKLRRYFSIHNFIDVPKFIYSLFQAVLKMYWFMPDVVFSKGGTGSVPVILAARFYRIPVVVHDSDALPGWGSRIGAKFADMVAVSFPSASKYFPGSQVVYTGNPIRQFLLADPLSKEKAKGFLGFNIDEPLVLILGGSQGAQRINDFIIDVLSDLIGRTQVLHQTGVGDYDRVLSEVGVVAKNWNEDTKSRYKAIDFFEKDMRIALQAADLIVTRSGANHVFELAAFGKAAILIPLPISVTPSQEANALEYQSTGGGIIMEQNNLLPNLFIDNVTNLLSDSEKLEAMGNAARALYKEDAASNLARIILRYK